MATKKQTADHLLDLLASHVPIECRRMFGEYGVFLHGKMVAVICDDTLFVRPTGGGRSFLGEVVEQQPFPRAKRYFLIVDDLYEDVERLASLLNVTAKDLPEPKPKRRRADPRDVKPQ